MPNQEAIDSNGSKFLTFSIINILAFIYLLMTDQPQKEHGSIRAFFRNRIGFAYTLFMAIILLSLSKAVNMGEAIITFSMYFTVFAATLNISIILRSDKGYIRWISIFLAIILILDSLTVFYNILLYINRQINTIEDIKSFFSNKNILTAAIFIKLAFSLWLITFEKGWAKSIGYVSLWFAFTAIFFMSARAFYFGTILIIFLYTIFILLLNYRFNTPQPLKTPALVLGGFIAALLFFTVTQKYLYPRNGDMYNVSVTERISQVNKEVSDSWRLSAWKNSAQLFKRDPILGVGLGNWKIRVLEYENKTKNHATYMVRNHNDFIQVFTETGVFGGLLFISILFMVCINFIVAFFRKDGTQETLKFLFIPAFGILMYGIDAFFNFPAERPEILSLFALLAAAGIAYAPESTNLAFIPSETKITNLKTERTRQKLLSLLYLLLLFSIIYIFSLLLRSQKLQTLIEIDVKSSAPQYNSEKFLKEIPPIPTVSTMGVEPLVTSITRYMISEGKYRESIALLLPDKSSPWDSRREFNLAFAYNQLGKKDSAIFFARKAVELKPRFYNNINLLTNYLVENSKESEAIKLLEEYVQVESYDNRPWLNLTNLIVMKGDSIKAIKTLNEARKYLPNDPSILKELSRLTK